MRYQGKIVDSMQGLFALTAVPILGIFLATVACEQKERNQTDIQIAEADTCEGPDANIECCFTDFPLDAGSIMKIAGINEPGTRIVIKGILLHDDTGLPVSGAKIYAYQTDQAGYYSRSGNETGIRKWHGRLHGWCVTDSEGKYELHTIGPGRYPGESFPAHIHWAVRLPGGVTTYLNDFVFTDDEYVSEKYLKSLALPGDNGVIQLNKYEGRVLTGERTTRLSR